MDHVPLDRAGTHDRNLDHKVIEFARPEARQHVDLRAAFDLEHANAVTLLQHGIGCRVFMLDRVELVIPQPVLAHQVEALADAGEHAQRQHIDLHQPQRIDIVLVPLDEGAILHRGIVDRHDLVEPPLREDETPDMLRQMARELQDPVNQQLEPGDLDIAKIEAVFLYPAAVHPARMAAPYGADHAVGHIFGQPERLAHFTHRTARTVVDHRGANPRAFAAIAAIDILHHLFTPLMFEIDIDIGRFAALFGHEAREQQVMFDRVDRSDLEQIADNRIGCRPAPLAQDRRFLVAGEFHQVVNRQEVIGVASLADQRELLLHQFMRPCRDTLRPAFARRLEHEMLEPVLRFPALRDRFVRVFIAQVVEREAYARQQLCTRVDRFGIIAEQPDHFARPLEVPLGIGRKPGASLCNGGPLADTAQHIVQLPVLWLGIECLVGRQERNGEAVRQGGEAGQPAMIAPLPWHDRAKPEPAGRCLLHSTQRLFVQRIMRLCQRNQRHILAMRQKVLQLQQAIALLRPQIADSQQPCQPPPAMARGRIGDDIGRIIGEAQPRAHDETEIEGRALAVGKLLKRIAQGNMCAHHPCHRVAIGNPDPAHAEIDRLRDHLGRLRGSTQERVIRRSNKFGKGLHQANSPCRYHSGEATSRA